MSARSRHPVDLLATGHGLATLIKRKHCAFTLVELLVVIAIVGILVALIVPAVQASREAARRAQCKNNLKQISLAFLGHESDHGHLPTSGWGYKWVGDPTGGYGEDQPGGWAYNILPYMEYGDLRDSGITQAEILPYVDFSGDGRDITELSRSLVIALMPEFRCPSKRAMQLFPLDPDPTKDRRTVAHNMPSCTFDTGCRVMRGDYRVNSGSRGVKDEAGPPLFAYPTSAWGIPASSQNGVSFQRSTIRFADISDGAAKTALVGEKFLDTTRYDNGTDTADDQCVFSGHDNDNNGYTADGSIVYPPQLDRPSNMKYSFHFGSAHPAGVPMAYCDGSVRLLAYEVDNAVWKNSGGRNDQTLD
jgi:prepilin-type N-terminal cleavage/methylation domain-containing protein